MRPIRSLLFAPANRHELLKKFPRYPADAFAIDLEDGTPESEKESARRALPAIVAFLREQGLKAQLFVRINASSRHMESDLAAALTTSIDGLIIPKVERVVTLNPSVQLIAIVETVRGVLNVESTAAASPQLSALAFGAEDFVTDAGGRRTNDGLEVLYARSRVVLAARAAGLQALDQVFVNIRDEEGFRRDANAGRDLGYSGKMCIVPGQIEIANAVFSSSPEEIERSRRLIAAYETAQAAGRGTIEFEGVMVDEPVLKRARAILDGD
jgi:citrate lyase subunit beta/citryl-CoA lyase